jgi:hypothetical protein
MGILSCNCGQLSNIICNHQEGFIFYKNTDEYTTNGWIKDKLKRPCEGRCTKKIMEGKDINRREVLMGG